MGTETQRTSQPTDRGSATSIPDIVAPLLVFLAALVPRVLSLGRFITWDEPMWVYRSIKFLTAIQQGNWGGTFQVGHPGVITMLCGSLGIALRRLLPDIDTVGLQRLSALPSLQPTDAQSLRELGTLLPVAKLPMALLSVACIMGVYLLIKQLFGTKAAFLAGLFLALDPFHLALSRVLHIDAAAANMMLLSLLMLLRGLPSGKRLPFVLSGVLAGLGTLSKAYSLFLVPFVALILGAHALIQSRSMRKALVAFAWWCLGALSTFCLLWPAMWVDPVGTVRGVLGTAFGYASGVSETSEFFLGKIVEDAGPLFYPVALAMRTTPLVWLGLLTLAVFGGRTLLGKPLEYRDALRRLTVSRRFYVLVLVVYAILFATLMGLATKKFDRYMLPVIMALDILAAVGLARGLEHVKKPAVGWLLAVAFILQSVFVLSYHPYYLAYYNPLTGGSRLAQRVMPLGWGEGMNLAADYLNQKAGVQELRVATSGMPGFAAFFQGWVEPNSERGLATSDYGLLYISDVQQNSPLAQRFADQKAEQTLQVAGMDYVWIYSNTLCTELTTYLSDRVGTQDALLMDAPSPLQKEYPHAHLITDASTEAAARTALQEAAADRARLWYIAYPESDTKGWINYDLSAHALLMERQTLAGVTLSCYALPTPLALDRADVQVDLNADFGQLRLLGYELADNLLEYRQALGVTLLWQTPLAVTQKLALSLRLMDEQGHCWAKEDRWLLNSAGMATSAWRAGETLEDRHLLSIPPGIPPGRYELTATVYDADTLCNLAVLDGSGAGMGTDYVVATITVTTSMFPPSQQELAILHPLSLHLAGQAELLGYGLSSEQARPGDTLEASLFWKALRAMPEDYTLLLSLRDEAGRTCSETTFPLASISYPTSRWQAGEILHGRYDLPIDAALGTGRYRLFANWVSAGGRQAAEEDLFLGELSVESRQHLFAPPPIGYLLHAQIGEGIALLGYDLAQNTVAAGADLHLTLYWQPLARIHENYVVFTHLLDAENRIVGQRDSQPCSGICPTRSWLEGEYIADEYDIPVDAEVPAGLYQIGLGVYDPTTLRRLPAVDEAGKPWTDDRIMLGTAVTVTRREP